MAHIHATGFYMVGVFSEGTSGIADGVANVSGTLRGVGDLSGVIEIISGIKFGAMYNWYSVDNVNAIAPTGWHVPTETEWNTMVTYLGGVSVAGGKMKVTGNVYWEYPNVSATNEVGFDGRSGGYRDRNSGVFIDERVRGWWWSATDDSEYPGINSIIAIIRNYNDDILVDGANKRNGVYIRFIRDTNTGWVEGEIVKDYDYNDYPTVQIGTQIWTTRNFASTCYRNGVTIPEVTDNATWAGLRTGALCAYNNDWSKVFGIRIKGALHRVGYADAKGSTAGGSAVWGTLRGHTIRGGTDGVTAVSGALTGRQTIGISGSTGGVAVVGGTLSAKGNLAGTIAISGGSYELIDFEDYNTGSLDGQHGWNVTDGSLIVAEDTGNNYIYGSTDGDAIYPVSTHNIRVEMEMLSVGDGNALHLGYDPVYPATIYAWYDMWGYTNISVAFNKANEIAAWAYSSFGYEWGDVVGFAITDTTLKVYRNGVIDTSFGNSTDTDYMTGTAGEYTFMQPPDWPSGQQYIGVYLTTGTNAKCDNISIQTRAAVTGTLSARALIQGSINPIFAIEYGLIYNWYAITDSKYIANTGWHVCTTAEVTTLETYAGGYAVAGGKLKEEGSTHWAATNTGTNDYGLNLVGAGARSPDFGGLKDYGAFYEYNATTARECRIYPDDSYGDQDWLWRTQNTQKYYGTSIRLMKDSTTLSHGETGTYVGNDGKVYPTICIGTQEWLAKNLCETKYRDGTSITEITTTTPWQNATTGALCAYNNDWGKAFSSGVFVTGRLKPTLFTTSNGVAAVSGTLIDGT